VTVCRSRRVKGRGPAHHAEDGPKNPAYRLEPAPADRARAVAPQQKKKKEPKILGKLTPDETC